MMDKMYIIEAETENTVATTFIATVPVTLFVKGNVNYDRLLLLSIKKLEKSGLGSPEDIMRLTIFDPVFCRVHDVEELY